MEEKVKILKIPKKAHPQQYWNFEWLFFANPPYWIPVYMKEYREFKDAWTVEPELADTFGAHSSKARGELWVHIVIWMLLLGTDIEYTEMNK